MAESKGIRLKTPILKLESKTGDEVYSALLNWTTKMKAFLKFHHCWRPVETDLLPDDNDIMRQFDSAAQFNAAVAEGYVFAPNPDIMANWNLYRIPMLAQKNILSEIENALAAITSSLYPMALQKYIATHPEESGNPFLIWRRINNDLYQPSDSVILMKRQEFSSMKIKQGESVDEFAIRMRNKTFELSIIDPLQPIPESIILRQFNYGITVNPILKMIFMGSQTEFSNFLTIEDAARQYTNLCQLMRVDPVRLNKEKKKVLVTGQEETKNDSKSSSDKGPLCWFCGKRGHLASSHGKDSKGKELKFKPDFGKKSKKTSSSKKGKEEKAKKSSRVSIKLTRC